MEGAGSFMLASLVGVKRGDTRTLIGNLTDAAVPAGLVMKPHSRAGA
jgi:hypothetical protein